MDAMLSGGVIKRIEIATVLARGLKVAIFDEPEAGIDLWSFQHLAATFQCLHKKDDTTIIIISHQERIIDLADTVILMENGQITRLFDPGDIQADCRKAIAFAAMIAEKGVDVMLNALDRLMLEKIADLHGIPLGACNIRKDGEGIQRNSTANFEIITKQDQPGINVVVKSHTKGESIHIPVILMWEDIYDIVYNTFEIGEQADVLVVAGCGIHNPGERDARHDGIHTFNVGNGARMKYVEKHDGEGEGTGKRILNPTTLIDMAEGSVVELELVQIKGISNTRRITKIKQAERSRLVITERLLTHQDYQAESEITVELSGIDSTAQSISRYVAKDQSRQVFHFNLTGRSQCRGHVQCAAIIMHQAQVISIP